MESTVWGSLLAEGGNWLTPKCVADRGILELPRADILEQELDQPFCWDKSHVTGELLGMDLATFAFWEALGDAAPSRLAAEICHEGGRERVPAFGHDRGASRC